SGPGRSGVVGVEAVLVERLRPGVDPDAVLETRADMVDAADLGDGTVAPVDPVGELEVGRLAVQDAPVVTRDVVRRAQLALVVERVGEVGDPEGGTSLHGHSLVRACVSWMRSRMFSWRRLASSCW